MDLAKYQTKSITPVDEYVFTLSDELREFARVELNETEEIRNHAIEAMRDWVVNTPRIVKCRLDSNFILRYLRFRKFDIPKAQEAFERCLIAREGLYGYDWFSNMELNKPNIKGLLDNGFISIFPNRDQFGRLTVMLKLSVVDPSIPTIGCEALTTLMMAAETVFDDEENQIRGFNYILDVSNVTLRHYFIFPFPVWFKYCKNIEKYAAARHKNLSIVNIHATLKFLAKIAMRNMTEKLRKRLHFYTSFKDVDVVPKKDFPRSLGGEVEDIKFFEPWRTTLNSKREYFLNYNNMKVNCEYYPKAVLKCEVSSLSSPVEALVAEHIRNGRVHVETVEAYDSIEFD